MKAIVYTRYGPPEVLQLKEIEKPVPNDDQVLVKVMARSVNAADWRLMRADPFLARLFAGLFRPKFHVLGSDIAGTVEAVGKNVKSFKPGQDVFGDLFPCGLGGFAEYALATERALAPKPANLSFEEAAAIPLAAISALQGLRDKGHIQPGQKVLINGASGGVGTFAVQMAKAFEAEVTGVCGPGNLELVRSLGADQVIDYQREDFTKNGKVYDLILSVHGYHPIWDYRRALGPQGRYVMVGGSGKQFFEAALLGPWISMTGSKKMGNLDARSNPKDLEAVRELAETGKIKPVIDKRYPLSEVAEAIRYVEAGHAKGKVVITN